MDWLTFIVETIKALAWPVTSITIILLLRKPLLQLIPEVNRFKWKDLEIEFDKKMSEVAKQAEIALPEITEIKVTDTLAIEAHERAKIEHPSPSQWFIRLAELSPPAAITEAWLQLEGALRKTASDHGIAVDERSNPVQLMKDLMSRGKVDRPSYEIFEKLRDLRNSAVHARPTALRPRQALEFKEISDRLRAKLAKLLH